MALDLSKIGSILRARREEKGINLGEVSNVLCLRKSLIEAIEAGNWKFLPHEVYVRSYLKAYANYLKIYNEIQPELAENTDKIELGTIPDILETIPDIKVTEKPLRSLRKIAFTNLPRKALVYPAIILILAGFYMIEKIKRDTILTPRIETTAGISSQSEKSLKSTVTTENQTTPAISEGKKLMITCKERTWVSAVIDDSEKKEFMLNAHEMIILNAIDGFDLLIGNAGGVELFLNGKEIEFTGKSGEVKRIKLS